MSDRMIGNSTKVTRYKRDRDMKRERFETAHGSIDTYILHRNTVFGKKGARFASMTIAVKTANVDRDESWVRMEARQTAEDLVFRAWRERFGEMDWENLQVRIIHFTFEILVIYRVQS